MKATYEQGIFYFSFFTDIGFPYFAGRIILNMLYYFLFAFVMHLLDGSPPVHATYVPMPKLVTRPARELWKQFNPQVIIPRDGCNDSATNTRAWLLPTSTGVANTPT
jgi:hypothetical protein